MDIIKLFFVGIIGAIISYLEPVWNPMIILGLVFLADIAAGILVDIFRNDDRIRLKKVLLSLIFLAMYLSIIASTFVIGDRMGDVDESLFFVKTLTYIFLAFYVSNTLRNICILFPTNKVFAFLYHWFGLQIVKRMPELYNFIFGKQDDNK